MTWASRICTVLALAAELAGILLVVLESKRAGQVLRTWRAANPNDNPKGSWDQVMLLNGIVDELLDGQKNRRLAITLVVAGAVLGAAANLL